MTFNSQQYSEFCNKLLAKNIPVVIGQVRDFKAQAEYIGNKATEKLQLLLPNKRFKRGLIDPLGSLIKVITSNLDHEDAVHFEEMITDVTTREQAISNKITIISEMLDHVINSSKIINENTKILNDRLTKIEQSIKSRMNNDDLLISQIINVFSLFIINFRTCYI